MVWHITHKKTTLLDKNFVGNKEEAIQKFLQDNLCIDGSDIFEVFNPELD